MIAVLEYRGWRWPDNPLDAAEEFMRTGVPEVREHARMTGLAADIAAHAPRPANSFDGVIIVFPHADFTHDEWRRTVIQQLARESAPMRVNAIVAGSGEDIGPMTDYLKAAEGVTGQMFRTDSNSTHDC